MIIRTIKDKNYSVINNTVLRDERLSWRARGVAAYLLTQPDNWTINSDNIWSKGTEGRDAVRSALKELEKTGYLKRTKLQDENGKFSTVLTLYEIPTTENQSSVNQSSVFQASNINTKEEVLRRSTKDPASQADASQSSGRRGGASPRKRATPDPKVKEILDAYVEVRGKNGINYGKESAWAKKIVNEDGTPEEVKGCYLWLKADAFWQDKPLSLNKIFETLPEYKAMLERTGNHRQSVNENSKLDFIWE